MNKQFDLFQKMKIKEVCENISRMTYAYINTDTTSAIRMFLTQAVAYDGIPFEIKKFNKTKEMKIMTEDEFLDRLASSRVQSREGKVIDADIAIDSIRNKYGL